MKKIRILALLLLVSSSAFASVQEYKDACMKGNADACDYAGDAYDEGDGVVKDDQEAYKYYLKACQLNSGYGCRWLGIYQDPDFDEYTTPKSYQSAFDSYTKGCNLEDSTSCNNMATAYKQGKGVDKDLALARKYYIQGCVDMDDGDACANLGYMYEVGQGVVIDHIAAAKYYTKGCDELENGVSCYNLGLFFKSGVGVKKSQSQAKLYFAKACEHGDSDGCSEL